MDSKTQTSHGQTSPSPVSPETQATRSPSGSSSPEPESVSAKGTRKDEITPRRDAPRNEAGTIYCDHEECAENPPTFKRRCEWKKHVDKHDRPYHCHFPNCKQKGFTYSGGLSRHLREVHKHEVDPEKFFWCPYPNCTRSAQNGKERGFTRAENLKEHERRRHSRADGTALPINPTPVGADAKGRPRLAPAISQPKAAASQPTASHQRHPSADMKLLPTPLPSIQPQQQQSSWDSRQLPPMKRKREEDSKLPSIASFTSPPYTTSLTSTAHTHPYTPITPAQTHIPDNASISSARSPRESTYLAPSDNEDDDPRETIKRLRTELVRKENALNAVLDEVQRLKDEARDRGYAYAEAASQRNGHGSQGSQMRHTNGFTPLVPNSRV